MRHIGFNSSASKLAEPFVYNSAHPIRLLPDIVKKPALGHYVEELRIIEADLESLGNERPAWPSPEELAPVIASMLESEFIQGRLQLTPRFDEQNNEIDYWDGMWMSDSAVFRSMM